MPREHATIKMVADEVVDFISGQSICFLATLDPDGSPWGDVAACHYSDGRLWFRVGEKSRALRNINADPRVCCTLESEGPDYYDNMSAMVHGSAVAHEGAPLTELDSIPDPVTGAPLDGPVFGVDLANVVSFDFHKIQRRFAQS